MTHWTEAADLIGDRDSAAPGLAVRYAPGALAFALSAALGACIVYLRPMLRQPAAPPVIAKADPFGGLAPVAPKADPFGRLAPVSAASSLASAAHSASHRSSDPFGGLVVTGFGSTARFEIAESAVPTPPTPPADLRPSDDEIAPLPPRRPSALARTAEPPRPAPAQSAPVVASLEPAPAPKAAASSGLFDKLFGGGKSAAAKTEDTRLAYAPSPPPSTSEVSSALAARSGIHSPGGGFGGFLRGLNFGSNPTSRFGDHVAVYDISARVVYLPNGTRIEAHSGLGAARDDPSKVDERMHGPTPPATYALSPREALFHGVAALRLTPIDGNVYGRAGLLAHTYMLGPDGDSNGCISFRDYDAFLRAYRDGLITKLVVVTRL